MTAQAGDTRQVTVLNHVTLDGVMQAPGRPDEDTRVGFTHGGWATSRTDEVMGRFLGEMMASDDGALLLGRRTYEDFFRYWPQQTDNPFADVLNARTKYVAARTLSEPLPWQNSVLLPGDAADAVAELKREPGPGLGIMGSGELIRSLHAAQLIDTYILMIHPLLLGSGMRLFADDGDAAQLALVDSLTTTTGVLIATYRATDGGREVLDEAPHRRVDVRRGDLSPH